MVRMIIFMLFFLLPFRLETMIEGFDFGKKTTNCVI
jgi:hypothetical protein